MRRRAQQSYDVRLSPEDVEDLFEGGGVYVENTNGTVGFDVSVKYDDADALYRTGKKLQEAAASLLVEFGLAKERERQREKDGGSS